MIHVDIIYIIFVYHIKDIHKRDTGRYNHLKKDLDATFVGLLYPTMKLPGPDGPCISEMSTTDVMTFEASISC